MFFRKSVLLMACLLGVCSVWAQDQTEGQSQGDLLVKAPNVQKRDVGAFHAIDVGNAIDLVIKQGNEDAVAVSATDLAVRDRIITKVEDGVLHIYLNNDGFHWNWNWHNQKMKAFISFRTLDKLSASGASDVYVDGAIKAENLAIHLSGASDFKGTVQANQLQLHQSGSSDSHISGSAANLEVHLSGASDFKGYGMAVDVCSVEASGSSDVQITVNKELNVSASGSSDIYYKGTAIVTRAHTSGSSSVSKKV